MANEDKFKWYDYILFIGTLVLSLGVGVYFSIAGGKQRTNKEYLLANRELGILPCCLSMLMSYMSAILVLGNSAEMYTYGIQLFFSGLTMSTAFYLGAILFIPLFYPLQLTSSFEYLEMRFKSRVVRLLGTTLSIINACLYMGLAMYAPSTAIAAVTPIDWWMAVLGMGVVATIYTSLGGMKAVVWTDVLQSIFYFAGLFAVLILGVMKAGGFEHMWYTSSESGRLDIDFSVDPVRRASFWSASVGNILQSFAFAGTIQSALQRYSSMKSLKAAKTASYLKAPLSLILYAVTFLIGMAVYTHYNNIGCDPLRSGQVQNTNQLLPFFVLNALDVPGLPGLFVATLFSGALSSVSTSMNGNSAITWKDFLEPHFPKTSELRKSMITKLLTVIYGIIGVALAFAYNYLPGHVMMITKTVNSCASAPLLGLFLLGAWFPCSNYKGALVGAAAGFSIELAVSLGNAFYDPWATTLNTTVTNCSANATINNDMIENVPLTDYPAFFGMSFMWYASLGTVTTVFIGIIFSYITGATDPATVDPRLVTPVFERVLCCLPQKWLSWTYCGVPHDSKEDELYSKSHKKAVASSVAIQPDHDYRGSYRKSTELQPSPPEYNNHAFDKTDPANMDNMYYISK